MRTMPLQFLTWGTITAAVGSAVWLSSADQAAVFCSFGYRATRHLLWEVEYTHVFAGPAMRDAHARDIDYLGALTTFTY